MFENLEFNISEIQNHIAALLWLHILIFEISCFFLVLADGLALLPIKYYVPVIEKLRQVFRQQIKGVDYWVDGWSSVNTSALLHMANRTNTAPEAFNSPHPQTCFAWKQNTKNTLKRATIQPENSGCQLPLELILLASAPRSHFSVIFCFLSCNSWSTIQWAGTYRAQRSRECIPHQNKMGQKEDGKHSQDPEDLNQAKRKEPS